MYRHAITGVDRDNHGELELDINFHHPVTFYVFLMTAWRSYCAYARVTPQVDGYCGRLFPLEGRLRRQRRRLPLSRRRTSAWLQTSSNCLTRTKTSESRDSRPTENSAQSQTSRQPGEWCN